MDYIINETQAIKSISIWLKFFGWKVLQDKKNNNDNKIFHVKGITKKPDLIGISPNSYVLAIEVKSGEKGKDLGKCSKLLDYFENYNDGATLYFDDKNMPINIYDFVIGTYFSPSGYLKSNEVFHIDREDSNRVKCVPYHLVPKKEYETTYNLLRRGIWDIMDKEKYRGVKTGIGALLSNLLDDEESSPAIFVMKCNFQTQRWRHLWLKNL